MANKKASIRLIQSEAIVSAWLHGTRIHDWSGCGKAHVGLLRMEIKHVNGKTPVHQISEGGPMKWRWVSWVSGYKCVVLCAITLCHMWLHQQGYIVVGQQCRGSNGKVKIEGYTRVSDEEAHHWDICTWLKHRPRRPSKQYRELPLRQQLSKIDAHRKSISLMMIHHTPWRQGLEKLTMSQKEHWLKSWTASMSLGRESEFSNSEMIEGSLGHCHWFLKKGHR